MVSVPQSFAALNHVSETRSSFQIEIKELDGDELCANEMSWIELRWDQVSRGLGRDELRWNDMNWAELGTDEQHKLGWAEITWAKLRWDELARNELDYDELR